MHSSSRSRPVARMKISVQIVKADMDKAMRLNPIGTAPKSGVRG